MILRTWQSHMRMICKCRQSARAAALRLLASLAERLREQRGAPALLPYLPAMMLPLVRLDEQSRSGPAPDTALPAHLAEVGTASSYKRLVSNQICASRSASAFC